MDGFYCNYSAAYKRCSFVDCIVRNREIVNVAKVADMRCTPNWIANALCLLKWHSKKHVFSRVSKTLTVIMCLQSIDGLESWQVSNKLAV